jgi:hypothetical protein
MNEKLKNVVLKSYEGYAANTVLRASVQAIPYVGGPLDTLLAGKSANIQLKRLDHFLSEFTKRLERIESIPKIDEQALYDLSINAMEKSVRARIAEKRAFYANILARHIVQSCPVDESEMALRIIAELEIIHIEILREAFQAPICDEPFKGLKVIAIEERALTKPGNQGPVILEKRLNTRPLAVIRYAVSDLVARGLLHDEGIGRWDVKAMEYFIATDTAHWISDWISEKHFT